MSLCAIASSACHFQQPFVNREQPFSLCTPGTSEPLAGGVPTVGDPRVHLFLTASLLSLSRSLACGLPLRDVLRRCFHFSTQTPISPICHTPFSPHFRASFDLYLVQ